MIVALQILDSGDLWDSVSARLSAAEVSLPKPAANPASRSTRAPLPAVLSALQPLVECYFALCSVCGLLGPPPQPPSFETVTPVDAEGQATVHAAHTQPESPRVTQDVPGPFSQCVPALSCPVLDPEAMAPTWVAMDTRKPLSHGVQGTAVGSCPIAVFADTCGVCLIV